MRQVLLKLHRWAGLVAGFFILIIAVTGALLVFESDIDRLQSPQLLTVTPQASRVTLQRTLENVRSAYPKDVVTGIGLPQKPSHAMLVSLKGGLAACVDPYTGEVLGLYDRGKTSVGRIIHVLHTQLLAGQSGEYIVGGLTVLTFLMALSGVILWWPRQILHVKRGVPWRRVNFDLHNVLGFYSAIFLIFITASGVIIAFEKFTDPLILKLDSKATPPADVQSKPVPGGVRLGPDQALRIADAALPGTLTANINVPPPGKAPFRIAKKFPEDRTPGGRSRVFIDQYSGEVLQVVSTRKAELGTRILNLKRSVHTGDLFGAPTQALAFVVCLTLAGQVVTGFLIWWKPGRSAL